jgi:hypothetical protein
MKKLFASIILVFMVVSVYAATARITSQYLIKANVLAEMTEWVINAEVEKLRKEGYNPRVLTSDEWSPNEWLIYIARLSIRNRRWYIADIGAVYRTNLISNTGRKYVVFTCITQGEYYRGSSELSGDIDYLHRGYEIY